MISHHSRTDRNSGQDLVGAESPIRASTLTGSVVDRLGPIDALPRSPASTRPNVPQRDHARGHGQTGRAALFDGLIQRAETGPATTEQS